ncbi:serine phosphatase RsbU [alpha proteobacterium U9-1i]|nr:serine phosphatase RsbU [alpha proteobacterium U9-1i]
MVDDDIFVRDALALGLNDAGFEVVTAPGAAAGLDIAEREGVDAIITDMYMPGSGGAQFITQIRERWPDMPIIAISGAGIIDGKPTEEIARWLGANGAMVKPFRARELANLLSTLLAKQG